jgi:hypothetical protein
VENVDAGHDNLGLVHETRKNHIIAHVSFLYPFKSRDRLLDEEAEKLMEAYNESEKDRVPRPSLCDTEVMEVNALDQGEVLERRRVQNMSGRPEVRFMVKDSEGKSTLLDVDGKLPPKRNKRSTTRSEDTPMAKRSRSGGTLDYRMHPDRQRSAFGVDVPSLFEDVADGSRGSRDHGEYGHDTTLTAATASEDPSTSAVGTQQYSDTLTAASNTSTHASEARAPASRNTFVAASKGMTQSRKSKRLEESARVAQEKKPCSAT